MKITFSCLLFSLVLCILPVLLLWTGRFWIFYWSKPEPETTENKCQYWQKPCHSDCLVLSYCHGRFNRKTSSFCTIKYFSTSFKAIRPKANNWHETTLYDAFPVYKSLLCRPFAGRYSKHLEMRLESCPSGLALKLLIVLSVAYVMLVGRDVEIDNLMFRMSSFVWNIH